MGLTDEASNGVTPFFAYICQVNFDYLFHEYDKLGREKLSNFK